MRAWGRDQGTGKWILVDDTIDFSEFYITALAQECKLVLGESPFFGNNGIPAHQSVVTQIYPDYYVNVIQQRFSKYFSSLRLNKIPNTENPSYQIKAVTNKGKSVSRKIVI